MSIKNYSTPTKKYKALISAVHSIYRLINSTYELNNLVSRLSRLVNQVFNSHSCSIFLTDDSKKFYTLKCTAKEKCKTKINKKKHLINNGIESKIIRKAFNAFTSHLIGFPLVGEDVMGGIVIMRKKSDRAFDKTDQEVLTTISEQAIIGIKNLQLYEEQQKIVLGSIKSLVKLLDVRMPQEYTHSRYFAKIITSIAHEMKLDRKQVESLKYASMLHDAGKIDIPHEILLKTTSLTEDEFKIIERHPVRSAQILRPLQILKPVIPIIAHHHERFNGTGYPSRLKGNQIPIGARIMAVADAFEAMVYGRPYRERMDIDAALAEIKKKSGSQFDPKVVEAFEKVLKKLKSKKSLSFYK